MREMRALGAIRDDSLGSDVDEETRTKVLDVQINMVALMLNSRDEAIDNHLTPEQRQQVKESLLASMSETPIVSPRAFEALHLTDAQKLQMEWVRTRLEPEFERHLEKFVENQMIVSSKLSAEIEKQGGIQNIGGHEGVQRITQKLMTEDPEYRRARNEMNSLSQAFSTQVRIEMFDVLTDEQWVRLQELIDNPPEHAAVFLKRLKEQRSESEQSGAWQPGPGSWRPGDAIPEGYRIERNTRSRFPRGE